MGQEVGDEAGGEPQREVRRGPADERPSAGERVQGHGDVDVDHLAQTPLVEPGQQRPDLAVVQVVVVLQQAHAAGAGERDQLGQLLGRRREGLLDQDVDPAPQRLADQGDVRGGRRGDVDGVELQRLEHRRGVREDLRPGGAVSHLVGGGARRRRRGVAHRDEMARTARSQAPEVLTADAPGADHGDARRPTEGGDHRLVRARGGPRHGTVQPLRNSVHGVLPSPGPRRSRTSRPPR